MPRLIPEVGEQPASKKYLWCLKWRTKKGKSIGLNSIQEFVAKNQVSPFKFVYKYQISMYSMIIKRPIISIAMLKSSAILCRARDWMYHDSSKIPIFVHNTFYQAPNWESQYHYNNVISYIVPLILVLCLCVLYFFKIWFLTLFLVCHRWSYTWFWSHW